MDEVAEVKSRLEIAEVVGAYVPLKQAGRNLKAPCPFHQEKSASFMVSPEKGIYHCFGCGEGGDIFNFVMKMEGMDFRQALELLARKAGVELTARKGENKEAGRLRARLYEAHELAVKYFQASLMQNQKALEYVVKKRKLNRQTVLEFQIGYAPDSWDALSGWLVKKGFTNQELLQAGLASQKDGRQSIYDLFRGRITFTICDREGRPVGFTGRVLDDSLPKYLNTPQTQLYDKSQAIFGLHLAKEAIRRENRVVLVEGNMDVIASHQAGVKNVVAASGTALTSQQLKQLSGFTKNIILAFDSDRAGMEATRKVVPLASERGMNVFALSLTDGKDADEVIQKSPDIWTSAISDAKEIRDYWLDKGINDFDLTSNLGVNQFVERMIEIAKLFANSNDFSELTDSDLLKQELFLTRVAEQSKIDIGFIRNALKKSAERGRTQGIKPAGIPGAEKSGGGFVSQAEPVRRAVVQAEGKPSARRVLEESLLAIALLDPSTRMSLDDLEARDFSSEERKAIFEGLEKQKDESVTAIAQSLTEQSDYIKILLLRGEQEFADLTPADRSFEAFGLARRLQMVSNKDIKQTLSVQMREAEQHGDVQLVSSLLKQYQELLEEEV